MKAIAKIVCCGMVLAWVHSAVAEEDAVDPAAGAGGAASATVAAAPDDAVVPTPPAPRVAVTPHKDKVDRARVEKRLTDKSDRTKKRSADAEKDAAERAARQGTANPAPAGM
jgi:hypothetical protein